MHALAMCFYSFARISLDIYLYEHARSSVSIRQYCWLHERSIGAQNCDLTKEIGLRNVSPNRWLAHLIPRQ
jgi:hypothetical protein